MQDLLDSISKDLARAVSRRAAVRIVGRTLFGVFVSLIGLGRVWARQYASEATSSCPSCGTCQQCDVESGTCGKCSTLCEAAVLCKKAAVYKPYVTLRDFIVGQDQSASGPPHAFVSAKSTKILGSTLVTSYTGIHGITTFDLMYVQAGSQSQAFAVQYLKGVVQYGYLINTNGDIGKMDPPSYFPSELSEHGQDGLDLAPQPDVDSSQPASILCTGCKWLCPGTLTCLKWSLILGLSEGLFLVMVLLVLCKLGSNKCKQLCSKYLCDCPPGHAYCGTGCCCEPCQSFVDGQCQDSCTGSETCVNNGCTSFCPDGEVACGGGCIPVSFACCGFGHCSYEGYYCCSSPFGPCCAEFQVCCGVDGKGNGTCCGPTDVCCVASNGNPYCCAAGQECSSQGCQ
jgi:hypothetical protein